MYSFKKHALAAAVAVSITPIEILAQSSSESVEGVEEVVVTARRRSESLQEVPISISPVTSEEIQQRAYSGLEDIAAATSGFTYEGFSTSGTNGNAVIRGMAQTFTTARTQNVAFFLNGIHLQRQSMMNFGLVDMERIEVVKGPQSAMYGRNAFAGAVNYITSPATDSLEASVSVTAGSDERRDIKALVSGPIIEDLLYGKINVADSTYDGHTRNAHPFADADVPGPHTNGKLGGWEDQTISVALELRPSENLEIKLDYYRAEIERESQPYYVMSGIANNAWGFTAYSDMNCNPVTRMSFLGFPMTANSWWCGEVPSAPTTATDNVLAPFAPDDTGHNAITVDPRSIGAVAETDVTSLALNYDFSDSLSFSYLFGRTGSDSLTNGGSADRDPLTGVGTTWDTLMFPVPGGGMQVVPQIAYTNSFSGRPISTLESDSHELRLNFEGETWEGGAGVYYSSIDDESYDLTLYMPLCSTFNAGYDYGISGQAACSLPADGSVGSPLMGAPDPVSQRLGMWHGAESKHTLFDDNVFALFAEAAYSPTESLTLRAEMRYTEEDKGIRRLTDGFGVPASLPFSGVVIPEDQETFHYFTPRLTAEYQVDPDHFVYASAAMGVKSGGFNNTNDVAKLTYDEEQNWTYELGSKNSFLNGTFQLNAALYMIDWEDLQTSQAPTTGTVGDTILIANTGDAESIGFEIDGRWLLGDNWSSDFAMAWANPEYDDGVEYEEGARFINSGCLQPIMVTPDQPVPCGDPDVGGNQLARTSEWQGSVGINYQAEVFNGWSLLARLDTNYQSKQYVTPLNLAHTGDRAITNANVSLSAPENWRFNIWGKNVLDEEYVGGVFVLSQFNKMIIATGMGPSYGATVSYDF
ncbi:TonB-dependent receptor [Microbulbifer agarilyticus]|uniref:TonB-dependent receptor n=1 Tax=Microbulbifer agarilyticus TaxID=260552 RepID=UPI001CD52772|nr:TonB-dependent receptor [Microbulbifer agarilyticus]MCA0900908.1 TonB-dependent receptor [Microbulbifer agarilyticus]